MSLLARQERSAPLVLELYAIAAPQMPPPPPRGKLRASPQPDGELLVEWLQPIAAAHEAGGAERFVLEARDEEQSDAEWKHLARVGSEATSYTFRKDQLPRGHRYMLRVFSENTSGRSEPLLTRRAIDVLVAPDRRMRTLPPPPEALQLSRLSHTSVNLAWRPVAANESDEKYVSGYVIEQLELRRRAGEESAEWTSVARVGRERRSFQVDALDAAHEYLFRVRALNETGSSLPLTSSSLLPVVPAADANAHRLFGELDFAVEASDASGSSFRWQMPKALVSTVHQLEVQLWRNSSWHPAGRSACVEGSNRLRVELGAIAELSYPVRVRLLDAAGSERESIELP